MQSKNYWRNDDDNISIIHKSKRSIQEKNKYRNSQERHSKYFCIRKRNVPDSGKEQVENEKERKGADEEIDWQ